MEVVILLLLSLSFIGGFCTLRELRKSQKRIEELLTGFKQMEGRIANIETIVTSRGYEWDKRLDETGGS